MKKTLKTVAFLAFTFAVAAIFAILGSAAVLTAEGSLGETVKYEIWNESTEENPVYTLKLTGSGTALGMDINGEPLKYKTREESVLAPYAEHIYKAEVGEGIEELGGYSLAFLESLTEVIIPESLVTVGSAALQDARSLRKMTASDDSREWINLENVTSIKNYAFTGCISIRHINLSPDLKGVLGTQVFSGCRSLDSITVPEGVISIGGECFKNCVSLRYVHFLGGSVSIDSSAFSGAPYVYIVGDETSELYGTARDRDLKWGGSDPSQLPYAPDADAIDSGSCGNGIFWQIKKTEGYTEDSPKYELILSGEGSELYLSDKWGNGISYKSYANGPFGAYLEYIVSARITAPITTMRGNIFTGMQKIEQIEIPASLTRLEGAVFEHCTKLKSVYIADTEPKAGVFDMSNVTYIAGYCFDGCYMMSSILLSPSLENDTIYTETFKNCKALTVFTVPSVIKKIEKNAFLGCDKLTEVIFESDASINENAFKDCHSLSTVRGFTDSAAETFALDNNIEFLYPCQVAIRRVGDKKLLTDIEIIAGQSLRSFEIEGKVCLLYTDPEGKDAYSMRTPITGTTTLYAEPLYAIDSLLARPGSALGLRALFTLFSSDGNSAYEVAEVGAIASRDRGTSGALLTKEMSRISAGIFLAEGEITAPLSSLSVNGSRFSYCAVGFEDEEGTPDTDKCTESLSFRGYIILRDRKTGEEHTFYTDMLSGSIYEKVMLAKERRLGAYSRTDLESFDALTVIDSSVSSPISRDKIMGVIERVATKELNTLYSGTLSFENTESLDEYLAEQYESTGDVPAVLRFDVTELFDIGLGNENDLRAIASDLAEFAKAGGMILFYMRPENPTREGSTGGRLTAQDWDNVLNTYTAQNRVYRSELGKTGMLLQFLKEEGVTVFVNLMPEISGNRWWCSNADGREEDPDVHKRYKKLWIYTAEYFEKDCRLDNIIWIFEGGSDGDEFFPGSDHADIYGADFESSKGKTTLSELK